MDEDKAAPEGGHKQDNDDEEMIKVVDEKIEVRDRTGASHSNRS